MLYDSVKQPLYAFISSRTTNKTHSAYLKYCLCVKRRCSSSLKRYLTGVICIGYVSMSVIVNIVLVVSNAQAVIYQLMVTVITNQVNIRIQVR